MTDDYLTSIKSYLEDIQDLDSTARVYHNEATERPLRQLTPDEETKADRLIRDHNLQIKQCWWNAQIVALGDPEFTYAEGYVCSDTAPIPIHHAWVEANDTVWELTMPSRPETPENAVYFGITVPDDDLEAILNQRDTANPLADALTADR
jgi:hypothetical protein